MNIIEALKSGKRFKRKINQEWYYLDSFSRVRGKIDINEYETIYLLPCDILAEDWEVEEEKRELSWHEIANAVTRYVGLGYNLGRIKKDLGFEK